MRNADHVVPDLHGILILVYKVAFAGNVCMQATDHYLVNGSKTLLTLLFPLFVSRLTHEQLETIAGEDQGTKRTRPRLKREIASLLEAKKILK